jgi:hypothetical protein
MKTRHPFLVSMLAAVLLLAVSPVPAQTYTLSTSSPTLTSMAAFQVNVKLTSPAKCGSTGVLLPVGFYAVKIESLGGSNVRATFSGNGKTCQTPGILTATTTSKSPTTLSTSTTQTFTTLGFSSQSQVVVQAVGTKLNVIVKGLGSNQILIGLTLAS